MIEKSLARRYPRYADDIIGIGQLVRWELRDKYTGEYAAGQLSLCIKHRVLDFLRKEKLHSAYHEPEPIKPNHATGVDIKLDLEGIDPLTKTFIVLRLQGYSYREIARTSGLSLGAVHKRIEKVRKCLT